MASETSLSPVNASDCAISVENVSKTFRIYKNRNQSLKRRLLAGGKGTYEEFKALDEVSLEIPRGSTFGLLGQNGSGKSTLLKCIAKILEPNSGTITSRGRTAAMLEVGSGFHPELTGRENIFLNGTILGMSTREIEKKFDDIVGFSGVDRFIDQPVKNYSSGMYVRLGFSVAIHVEPEILLVDEILAVGDMEFQSKCLDKFAQFRREGRTVVVVSHALDLMRTFLDEAAWLDHGKLLATGKAPDVIDQYATLSVAGAAELGNRFGSGEIKVTKMEFLDEKGTPTERVHTGQALTLRVHYECFETLTRPVFGASIDTREGTWVWGYHALDDGYVPETINPGTGTIDITIARLPLRPGSYLLSTSVQSFDLGTMYGAWQKGFAFDVEPWEGMESAGIVTLGAHFTNLQPPTPLVELPPRDHNYWVNLAG